MRRVAITGIGIVSPLGNTSADVAASLLSGRSGIRRLDAVFSDRLTMRIAAPVAFQCADRFDPPKLRMLDRASQFALTATQDAIADADLTLHNDEKARSGVFIGTGMGGAQTTDDGYHTIYAEQLNKLKPFSVLMAMNNAAAAWIGIDYGITGPVLTFSNACSSSAVAIGEAARRIASGETDVMIAGGTEAPLWLGPMKAWEALRTLAPEDTGNPSASCKPFSKNRSGMVLGEGAGILVLESWERAVSRGASIYAELAGYGLSTDAGHLTRPSVEGQARAMALALASAGMDAQEIDYLNAHGTGTIANDSTETAAIKTVFGAAASSLPVSSTKSTHGHLLGAAGAVELIVSLLAMRNRMLPPTMHLRLPDPECDLDYVPNRARTDCRIRAVMSSSFAFGGTNAVLIARTP